MSIEAADVKTLHDLSLQVLLNWLNTPPTGRREAQALQLLGEANQILYAACINLGAFAGNGAGDSTAGDEANSG